MDIHGSQMATEAGRVGGFKDHQKSDAFPFKYNHLSCVLRVTFKLYALRAYAGPCCQEIVGTLRTARAKVFSDVLFLYALPHFIQFMRFNPFLHEMAPYQTLRAGTWWTLLQITFRVFFTSRNPRNHNIMSPKKYRDLLFLKI